MSNTCDYESHTRIEGIEIHRGDSEDSNGLSRIDFDCPEGELITTRRRSSEGKKDKKKSERSENTSIVIGLVDTLEKFQELLEKVTQTCGAVRSHYYRAYQQCGFIYFHDEETAAKTRQSFDGFEFYGQCLKACAPLSYFDNELDARPIPPESARRTSKELTINVGMPLTEETQQRRASDVASAGEPTCTVVLKNLNFNLKQEKLLELLSQMGIPPQSVNYHYDQNGEFCGIAFAKYKRVEEASKALEQLAGLEIGKRKVKVEYKRRKSVPVVPQQPTQQVTKTARQTSSSQGSMPIPSSSLLDPTRMDPEQKQIMNELLRFMSNQDLSEFRFPSSLTMTQRSHVHMIAEYLGLYHMTDEENDLRIVVVSKTPIKDDSPRKARDHLPQQPQIIDVSAIPVLVTLSAGKTTTAPVLPARITVVRNTWPREHTAQPKGPDGTRGFTFGRGRRLSTPAVIGVPTFSSGMLSTSSSLQLPVPKQSPRSASLPYAVMHSGVEFQ